MDTLKFARVIQAPQTYSPRVFWQRQLAHLCTHPAPVAEPEHCGAVSVPRCQRRQQRVAVANPHGAADFLWYNYAPQVVNAAHNSGCFHICPPKRFFLLQHYYPQVLAGYSGEVHLTEFGNWFCGAVQVSARKMDLYAEKSEFQRRRHSTQMANTSSVISTVTELFNLHAQIVSLSQKSDKNTIDSLHIRSYNRLETNHK
jgi:hypothetical protein